MKCKILLSYIDYYESSFDVDDNFYSNGGYENALKQNNEMYGNSIYNHISNGGFNANTAVFNTFNSFNKGINQMNEKVSKNEEKTQFSSCEVDIKNEFLNEITINDFEYYNINKDVVVLFFKLNFDTIEEEFEEDFKLWVKTHNNINSQNKDDDWKFYNEPKRNIKLEVLNKSFDLLNCKLLELSNDGFFVLIEKIKKN